MRIDAYPSRLVIGLVFTEAVWRLIRLHADMNSRVFPGMVDVHLHDVIVCICSGSLDLLNLMEWITSYCAQACRYGWNELQYRL